MNNKTSVICFSPNGILGIVPFATNQITMYESLLKLKQHTYPLSVHRYTLVHNTSYIGSNLGMCVTLAVFVLV